MGCALDFQSRETGSSPVPRSNIQDDPVTDTQFEFSLQDFDLMARLYEYQAIILDREEPQETRDHYLRRMYMVRDEIEIMLKEIARAK